MQILTNKPDLNAAFYIARVGSCIGKPLREPYTNNNSFAVITDQPERDFALVFALYTAKAFKPFELGTCQPAIRIRDTRAIIETNYDQDIDELMKVQKLVEYTEILEEKAKTAKKLTELYARKLLITT